MKRRTSRPHFEPIEDRLLMSVGNSPAALTQAAQVSAPAVVGHQSHGYLWLAINLSNDTTRDVKGWIQVREVFKGKDFVWSKVLHDFVYSIPPGSVQSFEYRLPPRSHIPSFTVTYEEPHRVGRRPGYPQHFTRELPAFHFDHAPTKKELGSNPLTFHFIQGFSGLILEDPPASGVPVGSLF